MSISDRIQVIFAFISSMTAVVVLLDCMSNKLLKYFFFPVRSLKIQN